MCVVFSELCHGKPAYVQYKQNGVNQTVANNKRADQNVISTIVVYSLENTTAKLASKLKKKKIMLN